MVVRKVEIGQLQPTDSLRLECQRFFYGLSDRELREFRMPEIYICENDLYLPKGTCIITEGNNRVYNMASRRFNEIGVIVKGGLFDNFLEDIIRAREMRNQGVYSVYDIIGQSNNFRDRQSNLDSQNFRKNKKARRFSKAR